MPTISAAQALSDLITTSPDTVISTGLPDLDALLQNQEVASILVDDGEDDDESFQGGARHGGVSRGQVTEIYGPPGVGKTALGMQMAANVLVGGGKVLWIDGAHPLPAPRLLSIVSSSIALAGQPESSISEQHSASLLRELTHVIAPTLPHLLVLLSQKDATFPQEGTSVIVIDSLSTLINDAFPKTNFITSTPRKAATGAHSLVNKHDAAHWASTRKWSVLQHLISMLSKLAALRNIAIVILQQTATKMREGAGAILVPSISSTAWDAGIASRIVLFQDFGLEYGKESTRYAGVLKAAGIVGPSNGGIEKAVPFAIRNSGLVPIILPKSTPPMEDSIQAKSSNGKRKVEIGDSEGEEGIVDDSDDDYGWDAEDEASFHPDPQLPRTRGSEDIMIPDPADIEEEEEEEEEEEDEAEEEEELEESKLDREDRGLVGKEVVVVE